MMLPGQTGPTITKWYNKECSLVDIPGNCNAITRLYDEQENEINLADLTTGSSIIHSYKTNILPLLRAELKMDGADDTALVAAIKELVLKAEQSDMLSAGNLKLHSEKQELQQQLEELHTAHTHYEVTALLEEALENRKITNELRQQLAADYAQNVPALKTLLAAMPAYRSIAEHIKNTTRDKVELQWKWEDYETHDPAGKKLKELKATDPEKYRQLFTERFGE
ncbi:MAG: hypothetical protein H0X33_07080 [Taibaiella sp.]|nr:hypothetical protein [Taibaiella sp.]